MPQSLDVIKPQEERCQDGHALNFIDVFSEYQQPIYNYLLRLTENHTEAEDLTQETFVRVQRSLSTFRGESSLATWLYRIATNVSFDHFRRRTTQQAKAALSLEEAKPEDELADESPSSPEQLSAQSEMSDCVEGFVEQLPPTYRAALVMHDFQSLKNSEIAEVLDCSLDTVKIRLHRARKKLKASLNTGCDFAYDERNVLVCEPKAERGEKS